MVYIALILVKYCICSCFYLKKLIWKFWVLKVMSSSSEFRKVVAIMLRFCWSVLTTIAIYPCQWAQWEDGNAIFSLYFSSSLLPKNIQQTVMTNLSKPENPVNHQGVCMYKSKKHQAMNSEVNSEGHCNKLKGTFQKHGESQYSEHCLAELFLKPWIQQVPYSEKTQ